ncbi:DJC22 protein, partial [Atractosteus spatula]|nr:DJC22 protein [Atractosteus spatula]
MGKGVAVTYALWAVGGPLGLHHLYLRRDSHALLWLLTCGGFGVGWAREIFRIPAYVEEANQGSAGGRGQRRRAPPPPVSPTRFAGQVCVGIYFGVVALIGLSSLSFFYLLVLPLCVGAGVHLVSCAGHETSDLRKTLTACLLTSPIFYGRAISTLPISLAASVTAAQNRRYKQPTPPKPLGVRLYHLGLAWLAFTAPLGYCVFYNTTATLSYLVECVAALLDWLWFFPQLQRLLGFFLLLPYRVLCLLTGGGELGGLGEDWEIVLEKMLWQHWERERKSREVLSVSSDASLDEITQSYRELVKLWHPDHNPQRPEEAAERFLQIQEAYKTLLSLHKTQRGE